MNRNKIRVAIETAIDVSDTRGDLVAALIPLFEAVWYEGADAGARYAQ